VFPQIYDSEGFFVARLRKNRGIIPPAKPHYKLGKFPFILLSGKESAEIGQAAAALGLAWDETSQL